MTTTEIIVTESHELHLLTAQMQRHVDRTLAADRKGGEALWEKALAVADARAEATKGGDWGAFLQATGQHERAARRLVAIAERGRLEERFRTAIISGWLTFSVGAIAAQADDELLTNLLEQPTPPTHNQVKALTARPDNVVRSLANNAPARPVATPVVVAPASNKESDFARLQSASDIYKLSAVADALRKDDIKAASAVTGTIQDLDNRQRANVAIYARIGGKSIASVVAMLEAPTVTTAPALSAFPPGHVEAGIGMLERRLREGTTQLAEDMQWAATFRTQLDAAREGMQPEVYGTWSARLDSAWDALVRLEAYNKEFRCAHCRSVGTMLIGKFCQSCYSLTEAQKWPVGSEDARWRLKQALTAAEAMQDATIRAGRIAEIRDVADAHKIDLAAPIIEAPQAAPVKKTPATSQAILLQHAESILAGVIEAIPDTALHLVAALIIWQYEPSSSVDPRDALFEKFKMLAKVNIHLVETAIEKGRS